MNFLSAPHQCNHHTPILMTVHDFEQHVGFGYISFELPPIAVSVPCPLCFVEDNNLLNRRSLFVVLPTGGRKPMHVLNLQGSTGPKTGGGESEKSNQNRVHRGCNHHPTNDGNLCVFKSGGVFGTHSLKNRFIVWKQAGWRTMVPFLTGVTHPSSSCGRETLSNVAHVLPRMCIRSASSEDRLREIGLEENRPPRISI